MSHTDTIRDEATRDRGRGIAAYVTLVACGQVKVDHPAPASQLYRGDLTRKQIRAGARTGRYLILSAAHGLVDPDQVLAPYDVTVSGMTRSERAAWADLVIDQLLALGHDRWHVNVYAGNAYIAPLRDAVERRGLDVRVLDTWSDSPVAAANNRMAGRRPMIGDRKRILADSLSRHHHLDVLAADQHHRQGSQFPVT